MTIPIDDALNIDCWWSSTPNQKLLQWSATLFLLPNVHVSCSKIWINSTRWWWISATLDPIPADKLSTADAGSPTWRINLPITQDCVSKKQVLWTSTELQSNQGPNDPRWTKVEFCSYKLLGEAHSSVTICWIKVSKKNSKCNQRVVVMLKVNNFVFSGPEIRI